MILHHQKTFSTFKERKLEGIQGVSMGRGDARGVGGGGGSGPDSCPSRGGYFGLQIVVVFGTVCFNSCLIQDTEAGN